MRQNILSYQAYTQWETGIRSPASACGPAAIAGLVRYWEERLPKREGSSFAPLPADPAQAVNEMYRACGGTPLGMSAPVLALGLRRQLNARLRGLGLTARASTPRLKSFEAYRREIDEGRPVAVKFDKWFSLRWLERPAFDYHWTVGCGYRIEDDGTQLLIVHDAGTRFKDGTYTESRERRIEYAPHRAVLTLVALRACADRLYE
ncbi:C39 family peptidase [Saccharibacillus alkalitolerans]|uniref:Peptidase C39-like domain-containing protein n=1 Tax=Saccharibacillus alkalitolerans TaxID=2705290 RepID=A0ABX0FEE7_9BACL|nr:C39 family peptidase [Saccharibacillus alkalitolerans]NGZ78012.1 hypothetical protein [Saccharibacillus alkalitolerans]